MPSHQQNLRDRRQAERVPLRAMYTSVTATPVLRRRPRKAMHGHVYDISMSGARIELDQSLSKGDQVNVRFELPGAPKSISATGTVVWVHADDDDPPPGPKRLALQFSRFRNSTDHSRLNLYLQQIASRAA